MPWCPRCDEVFPEGPDCPRCRSALVESAEGSPPATAPAGIPAIKIPRRLRRAFATTRPAPPPRQLIALSMALVLVAGGFVLGRMSAVPPDSPVVRSAPTGLIAPADGSIAFLRPGFLPADYVLIRGSLRTGSIQPPSRFSSPFVSGIQVATVRGARGSVAVVLADQEGRSAVAAFPFDREPVFWLPGDEAAWETADSLLVREQTGVTRWRLRPSLRSERIDGTWSAVHQTATGAVLETRSSPPGLYGTSEDGVRRIITLPDAGETISVAPDGRRALISIDGGTSVWDGERAAPVEVDELYETRAAGFASDGGRIALLLREGGPAGRSSGQLLALLSGSGEKLMLHPLPADTAALDCSSPPVWDGSGRWVFVAPGDGSIHALEVGGVTRVADARTTGCGIAWSQ
jgi:hypothetical protein